MVFFLKNGHLPLKVNILLVKYWLVGFHLVGILPIGHLHIVHSPSKYSPTVMSTSLWWSNFGLPIFLDSKYSPTVMLTSLGFLILLFLVFNDRLSHHLKNICMGHLEEMTNSYLTSLYYKINTFIEEFKLLHVGYMKLLGFLSCQDNRADLRHGNTYSQ